MSELADLYRDLHQHPELSFQETRTAAIAAERLRAAGFQTTEGVGRTGVVGVLRNGPGPVALLRADMDALPVLEDTGLEYASIARGVDPEGNEVPIAHACGHDVHVSCLIGAAAELAGAPHTWSGTLLAVFQPAEELIAGSRAMIDDGLFERFGRPDVVLGQHVTPLPAGMLALRSGPTFAGVDTVRITLHGSGGHGSRPETTVDPVVLAAATVLRLQTIVSREVAGTDTAVLTVGLLPRGHEGEHHPRSCRVGYLCPHVRRGGAGTGHRSYRADRQGGGAGVGRGHPARDTGSGLFPADDQRRRGDRAHPAGAGPGRTDRRSRPRDGQRGRGPVRHRIRCAARVLAPGGCGPEGFRGTRSVRRRCSNGWPSSRPTTRRSTPRSSSPTLTVGVAALVAAARHWLPPNSNP